jgi:cytoskeletal protein CcmA (bactofilin family)
MLRRPSPSPSPASSTGVATPPDPSPGRRFTDFKLGGSVFGPTLHIRGSITGTDAVEIAGQVEGPIEVEGLLHVAEGARITGPVTATDAVIEGELQGRLAARGRVELRASAKVRAEVHAPTVAIAEGCFFDGRIHMGGGEGERGPTHFREKRRRRGRGAGHSEAQGAAVPEAAAAASAPAAPVEPAPPADAAAPAPADAAATASTAPASPAPASPGDRPAGQSRPTV